MLEPDESGAGRKPHQLVGLVLGPAVFAACLLSSPPEGLSVVAWSVAALALWMAIWWATEAVPLFVTALLPLATLPLLGVEKIAGTAAPYAHPVVFLLLGGFLIGLALEKWNLHRRIAFHIILAVGSRPLNLIAGKMLATAFLSMWITNTATTIMVLPIAMSLIAVVAPDGKQAHGEAANFGTAMMLGIAYAASIGGMASLVGSPTNLLAASYLEEVSGIEMTFAYWMLLALPISVVLLVCAYVVLTRIAFPVSNKVGSVDPGLVEGLLREMGPMTRPEKRVCAVFVAVALCWMFSPLVEDWLEFDISDTGIALIGAVALFTIPANWSERTFLLDGTAVRRVPWEVLILFGGGLSLAKAIDTTGLAVWIGDGLSFLEAMPLLVLIFSLTLLVVLLTELMSNTATVAAFLPIAGSLALGTDVSPLLFVMPIALAASAAFMLPVATPPNTLVFGTGYVTLPQMMRAGVLLNVFGAAIIAAAITAVARFL
ncbi:MAG: DASS family sodium-coupled anion symporter [Methyloceanibacter sp.]|nr:DASS family sodium-coupled anion symporter [Methyloceanibacter sp.]